MWPVGSKLLTVDGSCIPCIVRLILNHWTTSEALLNSFKKKNVFEELSPGSTVVRIPHQHCWGGWV